MTANQINHARNLIQDRYNRSQLQETKRANLAKEGLQKADIESQIAYRDESNRISRDKIQLEHEDRRYASDKSHDATIYAAGTNAAASRYVAGVNANTSRYVADTHAAASMYSSDQSLQGAQYSADAHKYGTIYSADSSRYNMQDRITADLKMKAASLGMDATRLTLDTATGLLKGWMTPGKVKFK